MDQGFPLKHNIESLPYKAGPKFTAAIEALATKEAAQRRQSVEARTRLIQEYRELKAQIEADR
jgi:hypothetical protein